MPKDRKVDTMPQADSFADKLRKRRMYIEEDGEEGLQKAAEVMQPKKKKNGEDED